MKRVQVIVTNGEEFIPECTPDPSEFGGMFAPYLGDADYMDNPDEGDGFVMLIPNERVDEAVKYFTEEWAPVVGYEVKTLISDEDNSARIKRWVKLVAEAAKTTPTQIMGRHGLNNTIYRAERKHRPLTLGKIKEICEANRLDVANSVRFLTEGIC